MAAALALTGTALAQADPFGGSVLETPKPAVVSGKDDYVPSEIVDLHGSGWAAGERVELFVNDDEGETWSHRASLTAAEDGSFEYEFRLPDWFVATYTVVATGERSGVVTTSFADSVAQGDHASNSNTSGTTASQRLTISAPAIGSGQIAVAQIVVNKDFGSRLICPPAGWTSILRTTRGSGVYVQETFVRTTPSAATSHEWTFRSSSCSGALQGGFGASGGVIVFSGANTASPIRDSGGTNGASGATPTAPSETAAAGDMVLRFFGLEKNTTATTGGSIYVERSGSPTERTAAAFSAEQTSGTSTGTFSASFGTSAEWTAQTVVVRGASDATAPAGSISINSGAASTNSTSVTLNLGATDAVGVTAYRVANGSDCSSASFVSVSSTTSYSANISHTLPTGDGSMTVCVQYRDAAGNISGTYTDSITLDTAAPTTSASLSGTAGSNDWYTSSVEVTLSANDATSGVASTEYRVNGGAWTNYTGAFTVTAQGNHTVDFRSTDDAGNAEAIKSVTFKIDTVAPKFECSPTSSTAWHGDDVTVSCTASDGGSGLKNPTDASFTLQTDVADGSETASASTGSKELEDNAGNKATAGPYTFQVDRKAAVSAASSPQYVTTEDPFEVSYTRSDGGSGVAKVELYAKGPADTAYSVVTTDEPGVGDGVDGKFVYAPTQGEGSYRFYTRATDAAGNVEAAPTAADSTTIAEDTETVLDMTKPETTAGAGAYSLGSWTNGNVTVGLNATDGGSGVKEITYSASGAQTIAETTVAGDFVSGISVTAEGTTTITFAAKDKAGNVEDAKTATVKIDKTAPGITFASHVPGANANGWNQGDVTVTWDCSDGSGSGVVSAQVSNTVTGEGASLTASGTCTDNAGNSAGATRTVKIDRHDPSVAITSHTNGQVVSASSINVGGTVSDNGPSGLASFTVNGSAVTPSGSSWSTTINLACGSNAITAAASDNAGRTKSATISVTRSCLFATGFYQPIGIPNSVWAPNGVAPAVGASTIWNVAKGGSTIPLKFNLYEHQGGPEVTSTGGITFAATSLTCAAGDGEEAVEFVTTGSTSLRYDTVDKQFIQNWKTPSVTRDTCYRVNVRFADNSAIFAFVRLRR